MRVAQSSLFSGLFRAFLTLVAAPALWAQVTCSSPTATPVQVRAEGRTELLADLTFTCTGVSAFTTLSIQDFVALPVRSATVGSASEAIAFSGSNSVQGIVSGSTIQFVGLMLSASGGTASVTVSNVRVDATPLLGQSAGQPILSTVLVSGQNVTAMALPQVVTGISANSLVIQPGLSALSSCANITPAVGPAFSVGFAEGFPAALKVQSSAANATPGGWMTAGTESGYLLPGAVNLAGSGTRIRVLFTNMPAGASVYLQPVVNGSSRGSASAPSLTLTSTETGPFSVPPPATPNAQQGIPAGLIQVQLTNGSGQAFYEVTAQSPLATDSFAIPVYLSASAQAIAGLSSASVSLNVAPTTGTAVPSFITAGSVVVLLSSSSSCIAPSIAPTSLIAPVISKPYSATLTALNVASPAWSVTAGALPNGLTLSAAGTIGGTPTQSGSFTFTAAAIGTASQASQAFTLNVNPPLQVTVHAPPGASALAPYSFALLSISGGTNNYSVSSTGLPAGLAINNLGQLAGTTNTTGIFPATATVIDYAGSSVTVTFMLTVASAQEYCTALNANGLLTRQGGLNEQLGSLSFSCNGMGGTGTFSLALSPAIPITSKLTNTATRSTEAILTVGGVVTPGILSADGLQLTFPGIVIPSGSGISASIQNLRADVSSVAVPPGAPVSIAAIIGAPVLSDFASVFPGFVYAGLDPVTVSNGHNSLSACSAITAAAPAFTLTVAEAFPGAFRTRSDESSPVSVSAGGTGTTNQATSGTRIRVLMRNIPAGAQVYVPTSLSFSSIYSAPTSLTLTATETGPFAAVAATTPTQTNALPQSPAVAALTVTNGVATAIYEVTADNLGLTARYSLPVYITVASGSNIVANSITAQVDFAPAGGSGNVPAFANVNSPVAALPLSLCLGTSSQQVPDGAVNVAYAPFTLQVSGGTAPYTFSGAIVPAGLSISSAGVLSGTPQSATAGYVNATVVVSDANQVSSTLTFSIRVFAQALTLLVPGLPVQVNVPYSGRVIASGGTAPYTFSITAGALPVGLALNATSGAITGTPTVLGVPRFTVQAVDSTQPARVVQTSGLLMVVPALTMLPFTPPLGVTGQPYATNIPITGGGPTGVVVATGSTLPPGLTLNGNIISGTPQMSGAFTFTLTASDGTQSASRTYTIFVDQTALTLAFPAAWTGLPYSFTPVIGVGRPPATFTITSGSLPAGLSIDAATGAITGIPTIPGVSTFSLQVTDSTSPVNNNSTQSYSLTVAQQYIISTVAGGGVPVTPVQATSTWLPALTSAVSDASGNLYFTGGNAVYKRDTQGVLTVVAGAGYPGYRGDGGPAAAAYLNNPSGLAFDSAGNLYIADTNNSRVRKVSTGGMITTLAGEGATCVQDPFSCSAGSQFGDGVDPGLAAIQVPSDVAVDAAGNVYIAESQPMRVRRITPAGVLSTVVSSGPHSICGMTVDAAGNLYLGDPDLFMIWKVSPGALPIVVAGTGTAGSTGDGGPATLATLLGPCKMSPGPAQSLLFVDGGTSVRKIDSSGVISTVSAAAGTSPNAVTLGGSTIYVATAGGIRSLDVAHGTSQLIAGDGTPNIPTSGSWTGVNAQLSPASGLAIDPTSGNVIFVSGSLLRSLSPYGIVQTIADLSAFPQASYVAVDNGGNVFFTTGATLRKFSHGSITTVPVQLSSPKGLGADGLGNVYAADTNVIYKIDSAGASTAIASGQISPTAMSVTKSGVIYFGETSRIGQIASNGTITTVVAGSSLTPQGLSSTAPRALAADDTGSLLFIESVLLLSRDATHPVTGSGFYLNLSGVPYVASGDGQDSRNAVIAGDALQIALDDAGNVYLSDQGGTLIRRLTPSSASQLFPGSLPRTGAPSEARRLQESNPGVPYSSTAIMPTGGTPPYRVTSTSLPAGLSINGTTGAISGTVASLGLWDFTVTVTDSASPSQKYEDSYRIWSHVPFSVVTTSLPAGTMGAPYAAMIVTSGGSGRYSGSATGLPPGLTLSPYTGVLSGTPTSAGTYTVSASFQDDYAAGSIPAVMLPLTINAAVVQPPPPSSGGGTNGGGGISFGSTLTVAPASLTFSSTAPQTITLTDSAGASAFTVNTTTNTGFGWLSASPSSGAIAGTASVSITVNQAGLAPGTYTGNVNIGTDKGGAASIAVTYNVLVPVTVAPGSLSFTYTQGDAAPAAQGLAVFSAPAGAAFTASASGGAWLSVTSSGTTPASLSASANVSGLGAGNYDAVIAITSTNSVEVDVPVHLTVLKAAAPKLSVSTLNTTVAVTQSGGPAAGQITVANIGGGTLQFSVQASADQGTWLSAASSGSATVSMPASVPFAIDPSGLAPGMYTGHITIKDSGSSAQAVVTITLAVAQAQSVSLSQTGVSFNAVTGGPAPPSQTVAVSGGSGVSALSDARWLSTFSGPAGITLTADQRGLAAGPYYATVSVGNQSITAVLNVTASAPVSVINGGLLFTRAATTQQVSVFNPTNANVTYAASTLGSWIGTATSGTLLPGPNRIPVTADFSALPAAASNGSITFSFSDSSMAVLQVTALGAGLSAHAASPPCATPGTFGVFRQPLGLTAVKAGAPQLVQMQLADACGNNPASAPQVIFTGGDAPVTLHDAGNGVWEATWTPLNPGTVKLQAAGTNASVSVTVQQADASAPGAISGVVNAASGGQAVPQIVTPGGYIAIYGARLAASAQPAASIPLPASLNGVQVLIGSQPLPLSYTGTGQINAVVPQTLTPNTQYTLTVNRGATRSTPIPVTVAAEQPGIFTYDSSGSGPGAIAQADNYLIVYCTGLGPLQSSGPSDGAGTPSSQLYPVSGQVTVTIGGTEVPASFAGLTPTLVALYQVNVALPAGVQKGDAVPVFIKVTDAASGLTAVSNTVTAAIR